MIDWHSITLFADLDAEQVSLLTDATEIKSLHKGDVVFSYGEPSRWLYILLTGSIKLFNQRKGTGKEETVCLIRPKGFFCLSPVINQEAFHINAKAIEDSQLACIPQEIIHQLIEQSHAFSKHVIRFLARKECDLCEEVCDLSLSTTKERLAKYLLRTFQESDHQDSFTLGLNQTDLASLLGTVRETVSRDLADLKKAGIIDMQKREFRVLNPHELASVAYGSRNHGEGLEIFSD